MSSSMKNQKWKAVINGRNSLNGERYSITLYGQVEEVYKEVIMADLMHDLVDHIESQTQEMEIKDSFQITLYPLPKHCSAGGAPWIS